MPLTGQPEFEIGVGNEPTITELNAWMQTITAKFNAAISTDDLRWPLKAGGHINMNGHAISGIPVLRAQYNLAERRPWVTVRMIFDEVEARGGGTVVLPGNTTQQASTGKDGITGIRIGNHTRFIGHGNSSICGALYASGKHHIIVQDMQLNGVNQFIDCDTVTFLRCNFTATTPSDFQLQMQNCKNVDVIDCKFLGETTYQLYAAGFVNLSVVGCHFEGWDDYACAFFTPATGGLDTLAFKYNTTTNTAYSGSHPFALIFGDTSNSAPLTGRRLLVRGNSFGAGPSGLYASGITELMVQANIFFDTVSSDKMIHVPNGFYLQFEDNIISGAVDYGMVFGDTLKSALNLGVVGNLIVAADEGLVIHAPQVFNQPSPAVVARAVVAGNYISGADAVLPAAAIWRLVVEPTPICMSQIWWGNNFDATAGFHCYVSSDASDVGGIIGGSTVFNWFQFCANTTPGTTTSGAANDDMVHSTADKTIVQNNNT